MPCSHIPSTSKQLCLRCLRPGCVLVVSWLFGGCGVFERVFDVVDSVVDPVFDFVVDPVVVPVNCSLFLKPIPFGVDENMLREQFLPYGELGSVRICRSPSTVRGCSDDHAFVRFKDTRGAQRALRDPSSGVILGQRMIIKLADADVAPKLKSGQSESEWIYCRGLPPKIPADDVLSMFSQFGRILDMKYFASTASYKGTGVLLRYTCVENAKMAIIAMNETSFPGCFQPLLVRFADSPAEKAAKMTRKDLQTKNNARTQPLRDAMVSMANAIRSQGSGESDYGLSSMPSTEYQASPGPQSFVSNGSGTLLNEALQNLEIPMQSRMISICGLPDHCDKLWVYENFAVFGAIVGVVMGTRFSKKSSGSTDDLQSFNSGEYTARSNLSDFTYYNNNAGSGQVDAVVQYVTCQGAAKAKEAMNGLRIGPSSISVALEFTPADHSQFLGTSHGVGASWVPHGHSNPASKEDPPRPSSALSPRLSAPLDVADIEKATAAMNLLSPYSSGFSDQMLSALVRRVSGPQNEHGGGIS
jgi:RNA recognition motif-containing protein